MQRAVEVVKDEIGAGNLVEFRASGPLQGTI